MLNIPHPHEHPVYIKIREKARQAKKWARKGNLELPLVLFIAIPSSLGGMDAPTGRCVSVRQALMSAILDERHTPDINRINRAGSWPLKKPSKRYPVGSKLPSTWSLSGPRLRVSGANLISGIVITDFVNPLSTLDPYAMRRRFARSSMFPNDHAEQGRLITSEITGVLERVNLNRVEYGLENSEPWRNSGAVRAHSAKARSTHLHGSLMMSPPGRDGTFSIEIPSGSLVRLLAGELTPAELWSNYSMRSQDEIPRLLANAVNLGQLIERAEIVNVPDGSRHEPRVRLGFGPPNLPTIKVIKADSIQ